MLDQTTKVFSGPGDDRLPSNVRDLSLAKRRQWVGAWNGRFKQCQDEGSSAKECESSAFAVANAAIKELLSEDESTKFYDGMVDPFDVFQAQVSQEDAEYDALGATGERGCANCRWFVRSNACILVSNYPDPIVPNGISNRWEAKKVFESQPLEVVIVGSEHEDEDADKATKTEGGVEYPSSDYAVVPDSDKPSGWKLRLAEGSAGNQTVAQVGRAITALQPSGFRGQRVQLSSEQKSGAISKIGGAIGRISGASADQKRNLRERLDGIKERTVQISVPQRLLKPLTDKVKAFLGTETEAPSPFVLYKDADGNVRWFAWASNKWRDRDNPPEILSDKAHQDYVAYVDRTGDYPEAWLWHTPGSKWGKADWMDYDNGFLLVSGTVDPGMEHVADSLARDKDLGVSHGFHYRHSDVKQGIIGWYRSFEVSPLPVEAAANPWTSLEVLQKELEETSMNAKKREFLVGHLGEEETARLETNTAELKAALEKKGVEWKEVPEDDAQVLVIGDTQAKEIATLAGKAAAEALVETPAFKSMVTAPETFATELKGITDRITELEKGDDEKIAAAIGAGARRRGGYQASQAADNTVSKEEAEKEDALKGPNIMDMIMEDMEIQGAKQ